MNHISRKMMVQLEIGYVITCSKNQANKPLVSLLSILKQINGLDKLITALATFNLPKNTEDIKKILIHGGLIILKMV